MKIANGFTLIELILTIIIVAIVALASMNTLQLGFQSYNDSVDRQDNQMQAMFLVEKFSRELMHAVPNSVEVSSDDQCVSFIATQVSAFYLSLPALNQSSIDVVLLANKTSVLDGLRLAINPSSQADLINSGQGVVNIDSVQVSGAVSVINFSSRYNPAFISGSVAERAFIYRPNIIQYCIQSGGVFRNDMQLANHISAGSFSIEQASNTRNNVIKMILIFENDLGETIQYQHDVQVINAS